jgi:uncharacterized membrane protein YfbV (UPF0208 family)
MPRANSQQSATPDQVTRPNLKFFILTGLFQGVSLWLATTYWPDDSQNGKALMLAAVSSVIVFALTLQLTTGKRLKRGFSVAAAGLSCLFALLALWYIFQIPDSAHNNSWTRVLTASSILGSLLLFSIALPFIQSWPNRKNGHFRYADLYRHSWDNFFILLVAALLTGAYWLLIVLWVMLFKMVGITLFQYLFFNALFALLTLPVVFSLGIRIGLTHDRIITTLRQIVLSLCGWLMPLLAVITFLFGASLPFTGLQSIWDTGYSTPILLCLLGANILLLNGIYQDGRRKIPYPRPLLYLVEGALLLMPVFALIGIYSTFLRIEQYGLTPKRIYLALLLLVACCYSFSYAYAVIRRSSLWMSVIRPANTAIALLICLCIVLIHSPLLNPVALSARHQISRLLSGRVQPDDFDFGALKFQFGIPGEQAIEKMGRLPATHQLHKEIISQLTAVNHANSYYAWKQERMKRKNPKPAKFSLLRPVNISLDGLENELDQEQCRHTPCLVYPIDLNNDNREELIVIDTTRYYHQMLLFGQDNKGNWRKHGVLGDELPPEEQKKLVQQLKNIPAHPASPLYQSLEVGGVVYHFSADKLTKEKNRFPSGTYQRKQQDPSRKSGTQSNKLLKP